METQTQKSDMGTQWGKKQVGQIERVSLTYTHTTCMRESGGPALQGCDSEGRNGWGRGKLNREGTYICIIMRGSHCCVAETYTTLETSYLPIKT